MKANRECKLYAGQQHSVKLIKHRRLSPFWVDRNSNV